jgi:ABC-type polysaccharide/polyol phosphate transport system ATPase subunit
MKKETIITIDNVSMMFNMSTDKISGIKEYVIKLMKGELLYKEFWALHDISLEINRGEIYGFVGLNGAGKSTLLKIIAGVFKPTKGNVAVCGKIVPLIELGAGFDPDLSAVENVYLNGEMFGYPKKYMTDNMDAILDFAELQDFRDAPVKNYSSGMVARLGFAIAVNADPDILIVDEVLSVGDYKFQEKCKDRIKEIMNGGATILFVSHSIKQVRELCTHAALLSGGRLIATGDAQEVCDIYENSQ